MVNLISVELCTQLNAPYENLQKGELLSFNITFCINIETVKVFNPLATGGIAIRYYIEHRHYININSIVNDK
jgi:hypothetical protein